MKALALRGKVPHIKRVLITFALVFGFLTVHSEAQQPTAQDTLEWINNNIQFGLNSGDWDDEVRLTSSSLYAKSSRYNAVIQHTDVVETSIAFSQIKAIHAFCNDNGRWCDINFVDGASETTQFQYSFKMSYIDPQRVYNAFRRLAELNGAHLSNPNTF
jgi:hypothetical protein